MSLQTKTDQPKAAIAGEPVKMTKAQRRSFALERWDRADRAASEASAERNAAKAEALNLCDDGKLYKAAGVSYMIQKTTERSDASGVLKWLLSDSCDFLTSQQKRAVEKRMVESIKTVANPAPIKRVK